MAQVKNLSSWIVARNVFTAVAADPQAGKARREVKMKTQENKQFLVASNKKMKNKWWKIKTRQEHSEHGKDYQNEEAEKKGTGILGWVEGVKHIL